MMPDHITDMNDCMHQEMEYSGLFDEVLCKDCGMTLVGKDPRKCPQTGKRCIYDCEEDEDCWSEMNGA
jgi:hypothetical protein